MPVMTPVELETAYDLKVTKVTRSDDKNLFGSSNYRLRNFLVANSIPAIENGMAVLFCSSVEQTERSKTVYFKHVQLFEWLDNFFELASLVVAMVAAAMFGAGVVYKLFGKLALGWVTFWTLLGIGIFLFAILWLGLAWTKKVVKEYNETRWKSTDYSPSDSLVPIPSEYWVLVVRLLDQGFVMETTSLGRHSFLKASDSNETFYLAKF